MPSRLLFLSQTLPFPPDSGVKIRTYHTLRILSRDFDVTALCFYRRRQTEPENVVAALSELERFAVIDAFDIPQEWSRLRWVRDHVASVLRRKPYTDYAFQSAEFSHRLDEVLSDQAFDLVHLESSSLTRHLDRVDHLPTVCVHHNVESQLLERRADIAQSSLKARYLRLQARHVRTAEARTAPRIDLNITVSDEDADTLQAIAPGASILTIPNGVDTDHFRPDRGPTSGVALLGGTDWAPNLDALEHFGDEILPRIRARRPDTEVVGIGRASRDEIDRFERQHGIRLTGYVDDIRPHVRRARCVAVPLRVGGGSRLKILDSWAMAKAVVTTSVGCEGLAARDGENVLIADDPAAFAGAVLRLLEDPDLARSLGQAARDEAVTRYSWDAIAGDMRRAYRGLLEG